MAVKVTFQYDPDEPDTNHEVGMSEEEYERLTVQVMSLGGYDMEVENKEGDAAHGNDVRTPKGIR